MGWGERIEPKGDMGLGSLTTSQQITQRSIERGAAARLARAVRDYLRDQTKREHFTELEAALKAYDQAHT